MKVTVYQHVYVSGDKTMTLVLLVDENGSVFDRHTSAYEAYPLNKIAWDNFEYVTKILRRCFNADTIDFNCNVLGRYHLTKQNSGYARKLVEHRLLPKDARRVTWSEPVKDEEEEAAA
jgi:hypothetical protein